MNNLNNTVKMRLKLTFDGTFNIILGSMWSGKSTELIRRYRRYTLGGKKCIVIKYKNDTRYDPNMLVTHDKNKVEAFVCQYLFEADNIIKDYDVICIDEVQFYKDAHIFIDKWANVGKIVEACGLNGTFNRTEFPIISKLIPLAENITFLTATCKETGNEAVYSNINIPVNKNVTEVIGGSDKYSAVDRQTFFKNKPFYTFDLIKEFMLIYTNILGYTFNENLDDELSKFIDENDDMDLYELAQKFIWIYVE